MHCAYDRLGTLPVGILRAFHKIVSVNSSDSQAIQLLQTLEILPAHARINRKQSKTLKTYMSNRAFWQVRCPLKDDMSQIDSKDDFDFLLLKAHMLQCNPFKTKSALLLWILVGDQRYSATSAFSWSSTPNKVLQCPKLINAGNAREELLLQLNALTALI